MIGAGPAGSALSIQLAKAGLSVGLADQKDFPRPKPCGEFLGPQCLPYLKELGLEQAILELGPVLVRGMHLHGHGAAALGQFRPIGERSGWMENGYAVRRERFDQMLVQAAMAAGVHFLPRHHCTQLLHANDGRIVGVQLRPPDTAPFECRARFVIGADGVHSRIARLLQVQHPLRWLDQFALAAHFRGVAPATFAEVHLMPEGFFAATTVDDALFSVNLVVPRGSLRHRGHADMDTFVAGHFVDAPWIGARLRGAERVGPWRGIGPLAFTTTRQTFAGAALVGDACGYVDPLTGEGIYAALFSARALSDALLAAFDDPKQEQAALASYVTTRRRELGPRMFAATALQRAVRHPWLVSRFLRLAARFPALADLVVTLSGDTIHPHDLLRPSFWRAFRAGQPDSLRTMSMQSAAASNNGPIPTGSTSLPRLTT